MRRPMMAGNWKMNKNVSEALALAREIHAFTRECTGVDQALFPPAVCLHPLKASIGSTPIALGAQNCHWQDNGAYTGEISPPMLCGLVDFVLVGHSERRQLFGETDRSVNRKTKALLAQKLAPVVCVGETLEQNESGQTVEIVGQQVRAALAGLGAAQVGSVVIAYEPVWAIGTGRAATAQTAGDVCVLVRAILREAFSDAVASAVRILYGGSANPDNIGEIMEKPEIDGALVGGASLDADSFSRMVLTTEEVYAG